MARMGDIRLKDLSELETGKLLRVVYSGPKPAKMFVLVCACSARTSDIRKNPRAWDGWKTVPFAECPKCLANNCENKES